jgi:ferric hydroxamate transport system substrate-binding protein
MRRLVLPGLLTLGLTVLTACGTTQEAADSAQAAEAARPSGPVEVTDSLGRTVSLEAPAERVVVLEWQQVEDVLTLGVDPVGVADVEGYNTWDTAEPLDPGTTDVGMRGEPSLDAVFSTDPDLVIAEAERGAPIIEKLESNDVPVLVTQGADAQDAIGQMKENFASIATLLGKESEAEQVLGEFDASVEEARAAIAEADLETTEFAYADAWLDGSNVSIRMFGEGSLVSELGEAIGLTNAWTGKVDPAYGLGNTDVEGMTAVGDAHLFYTSTESEPWVSALDRNAVWRDLPFVTEERLHPFPDGIWTFGGPRSSQQVLDAYVAALT